MKIYFIFLLSFLSCCCAVKVPDTKTHYANEILMIDAYYKYQKEKNRAPKSIEDLVVAGYLPERGYFYSKDTDMSFFPKKPHYTQSDYKIFPPKKGSHAILGSRSDIKKSDWVFTGNSVGYAEKLSGDPIIYARQNQDGW